MYYLLISKNSLGELFTCVCVSKVHKLLSTQVVIRLPLGPSQRLNFLSPEQKPHPDSNQRSGDECEEKLGAHKSKRVIPPTSTGHDDEWEHLGRLIAETDKGTERGFPTISSLLFLLLLLRPFPPLSSSLGPLLRPHVTLCRLPIHSYVFNRMREITLKDLKPLQWNSASLPSPLSCCSAPHSQSSLLNALLSLNYL